MIIFLIFLYLIPTVIAVCRKHSNTGAIVALNILTGWTFLGWVASLVWSFTDNVRRVEVVGMQPPPVVVYAPPIHPAITSGFGGAQGGYLPSPLPELCRIRQNAYSRLWYIESAINPQYTWNGSGWNTFVTNAQMFAFPEGAQAEAQLRGFQVIA